MASNERDRYGRPAERTQPPATDSWGNDRGRSTREPASQGSHGSQDKQIKDLLMKLGHFMAQHEVTDLARVMRSTVRQGVRAAELAEFLNFLQGKALGLSLQDAMMLSSAFMLDSPSTSSKTAHQDRLVDLSKLESQVLASALAKDELARLEDGRQGRYKGYHLLERAFEIIQDYVVTKGGSIFKVFKQFDQRNSNFLNEDDILAGLKSLGATGFTREDARGVIALLDVNNDGKISYLEFANKLAGWSASKAIDDTSHWAFYLFEDIRRKVEREDLSLLEVFRVRQDQRARVDLIEIPWPDFLAALDRLPARMRPQ